MWGAHVEVVSMSTAVYFGATDADKACDALVSDLLKVGGSHWNLWVIQIENISYSRLSNLI